MSTVTYTDLRQNLARYLDKALNDRAPITVVRQGKENVILIAEQEYTGMLETLHLLSSPANAEMLLQSIEELNAGKGVERELIYPTIPTPA